MESGESNKTPEKVEKDTKVEIISLEVNSKKGRGESPGERETRADNRRENPSKNLRIPVK